MKSSADRVARFVDELLHGRRPRRFNATEDEADAMQAAAGIAAARLGADLPDKAALDRIHEHLSRALDERPSAPRQLSRRAWLRTAGAAAAAVVVGVALDEVVTNNRQSNAPGESANLVADSASWRPVAAVTEVPDGHALHVSTLSVDAVIINDGGTIAAVSGVCTHLGCNLQPDDASRRLNCPCHQTAFDWSGRVLYYRLKSAPPNLPHIPSRVMDGQIELFIV